MTPHCNIHPPKILSLRKRADFLRVRNSGKSVATRSCIIQYAPQYSPQYPLMSMDGKNQNGGGVIGVGFTATKKIGKATVRNRAKRRLRAVVTDKSLQLKSGYDIVFIARTSTPHRRWHTLVMDMKQGLAEAGLMANKTKD